MMKLLRRSIGLLLVGFFVVACEKDDDIINVLEVDHANIEIGEEETIGIFTITTDADLWEIENTGEDWLSLSRSSGATSKALVTITVDGKTPEERTAVLIVRAGNALPVEVTVIQAGSEFLYGFSVDVSTLSLKMYASSVNFNFSTTAPEWNIESDSDWLVIDETSGADSNITITLSASGNDTGSRREATIVLSAQYTPTKSIVVSQNALYPSYNTTPVEPDMTGVEKPATELANEMVVGWNLGNTLEAYPGGETSWGNARTTQSLIDAVKEAGYNAVRIPCAWSTRSNPETALIDAAWLARVQEVVDYCMNNDMYAIINTHWDGGWLEENPFYSKQKEINLRFTAFWEQIATYFRDYDERLLFAGTNEVRANYGNPTSEHIAVQESFNQTFVNAVRSTGGRNAYRNLVVQTYNTNIDHAISYFSMPEDVAENRLFVEVHYYDPYHFALVENLNSAQTVWGADYIPPGSGWWGQEDHADRQFDRVNREFVMKGIPVIVGEYGAIHRTALPAAEYQKHKESREYYLEYITRSMVNNGLIPFYWDNGYRGNNGFALFNRANGNVADPGALEAIIKGATQ